MRSLPALRWVTNPVAPTMKRVIRLDGPFFVCGRPVKADLWASSFSLSDSASALPKVAGERHCRTV